MVLPEFEISILKKLIVFPNVHNKVDDYLNSFKLYRLRIWANKLRDMNLLLGVSK